MCFYLKITSQVWPPQYRSGSIVSRINWKTQHWGKVSISAHAFLQWDVLNTNQWVAQCQQKSERGSLQTCGCDVGSFHWGHRSCPVLKINPEARRNNQQQVDLENDFGLWNLQFTLPAFFTVDLVRSINICWSIDHVFSVVSDQFVHQSGSSM